MGKHERNIKNYSQENEREKTWQMTCRKNDENYKQDAEQKTKEKLLRIFLSIELEMV